MSGNQALSPAEIYERDTVPAMFAGWVDPLLDLVDPRAGERLLDVACGTGVVARAAVARVGANGKVFGLDMNANMLSVARAVAPAVEYHEGNGMAMPLPDDAFDVVVCQQGLQFFPDPGVGLREMRRVLRPGGRLGVALWGPMASSPVHLALVSSLERHVNAEAARIMSMPFRLDDREALRALAEGAGFQDVRVEEAQRPARFPSAEAFTRAVLGGGTLARAGIMVTGDALDAVIADVDREAAPFVGPEGLAAPMTSRLVFGRA